VKNIDLQKTHRVTKALIWQE